MPEHVRRQLHIIAETKPQPQMPIAIRSDMPVTDIQRIKTCLLNLSHTKRGRKTLEALGFKGGFVQANDAEYLGVH
jgi:phosphonate transport system substrate-binding protein